MADNRRSGQQYTEEFGAIVLFIMACLIGIVGLIWRVFLPSVGLLYMCGYLKGGG